MSILISLDIKLDADDVKSCEKIIDTLLQGGWTINNKNQVTFLPLNDNDMFDWTTTDMHKDDFMLLLQKKEKQGEVVGVAIFWQNTDIGGHLLFHSNQEISFMLDTNIQYIDEETKIPDFNWYVEKIIPTLKNQYRILTYQFEVLA